MGRSKRLMGHSGPAHEPVVLVGELTGPLLLESEAAALYRKKKSRRLASLWNATETAKLVAKAALENENSLGAHYRVAAEDPPRIYTDDEMENPWDT